MSHILGSHAPTDHEPPPERLQISHLFLWTAMSSVLLGFDRATSQPSNGELGRLPAIIAFCYAPLFGAGTSAIVLWLWRWFRAGPRFPAQPGHWLLLLLGIGGIVQLGVRASLLFSVAGGSGLASFIMVRMFGSIAAISLYAYAIQDSRSVWRFVFWLGLIFNVLSLLATTLAALSGEFQSLLYRSEIWLAWLFTAAMLLAALTDLGHQNRRDYLHWTGIVARIGYMLLVTAIPFLIRWMQSNP